MTVKAEWQLKKWHMILAILAVAIPTLWNAGSAALSYIGGRETMAVQATRLATAVDSQAKSVENNTREISRIKRMLARDQQYKQEIIINLKHLMHSQGLRYEEVSGAEDRDP